MSLLEAKELSKRYGAVVAVRRGTLVVEPGEVHALLGANGAGKSTMVKMLTGVGFQWWLLPLGLVAWLVLWFGNFAVIEDGVTFDVVGAGFVTEAGDEIGAFRRNFALRSAGSGAGIEARQDVQDFGHEGNGFWFQGGGVEVEGNVAAGQRDAAFVYFTRGLVQAGLGTTRFKAANLVDPSIAGAETSGVENAQADLFEGAVWYLTPLESSSGLLYERLHRLVKQMGARPVAVDPETHDRLVAVFSHLPHVVANVLANQGAERLLDQSEALRHVGPSFRDGTRVAGANTAMWTDVYAANREAVVEEVRRFARSLDAAADILESGEGLGPFGARGIGEPPIGPPIAVIPAAIADAVGGRPTTLPVTPERVLERVDQRRAE